MSRLSAALCAVLLVLTLIGTPMVVFADTDHRDADLTVYTESYIDGSGWDVDDSGERVIYTVTGNNPWFEPTAFNRSDVSSYGVDGSVGDLRYDDRFGVYRFDAEKTSGQYELYWIVSETREREVVRANETIVEETQVSVRYTAVVEIQDANIAHVDGERFDELRDDARNWNEWVSALVTVVGPSVDVERETQAALEFVKFKSDSLGYLTDDLLGATIILGTTFGGLFLLTLLFGVFVGVTLSLARYRNRRETLDPDELTIDEKRDEIDIALLEQSLEGTDLNTIYNDDDRAQIVREAFGCDSALDAILGYLSIYTDDALIRDRLSVVLASGYRVVRDGDDVSVVDPDTADGIDSDLVDNIEDLTEDEIDAIAQDPVFSSVRLQSLNDAPEPVELPEYDLRGLLDELDVSASTPTERREQARHLIELLEHARKHPTTDSSGELRPMRLVIESLLKLMFVASDKQGLPQIRWHIEQLLWLLDETSVEDDVKQVVNRTRSGDFSPVNSDD